MTRALVVLAIVALLVVRFGDMLAHAGDDETRNLGASITIVLDEEGYCGPNDFHASAHCASHMADSLQRSQWVPVDRAMTIGMVMPLVESLLADGRVLSPPVPPPLA